MESWKVNVVNLIINEVIFTFQQYLGLYFYASIVL